MGTSLTGLTPATTYDALIKVGDNGALSATAKVLSDGLGNDSPISMSTTRVGIGTSTPSVLLDVVTSGSAVGGITLSPSTNTNGSAFLASNAGGSSYFGRNSSTGGAFTGTAYATVVYSGGAYPLALYTNDTERMRITDAGNVGIGTSSPTTKLVISNGGAGGLEIEPSGLIQSYNRSTGAYQSITLDASDILFRPSGTERGRFTANGLTFNGDTAAANALDDYEEGTFTATLSPSVSGTISLSPSTCSYTKIGRQVTVRGQIVVSAVSSPVGSIIVLGGLPFTSQNAVSSRGAGVFQYFPSIGSGSLVQNYQLQNSIEVNLISTASTIVAGDEFYISLTYFV
jgi:hypothetical protein